MFFPLKKKKLAICFLPYYALLDEHGSQQGNLQVAAGHGS
jgi:hypothetical protein